MNWQLVSVANRVANVRSGKQLPRRGPAGIWSVAIKEAEKA
jgi:hypothetical protein